MREFELILAKEIRSGLRPYEVPKSDPSVVECYNLEPGENGLKPYVPIENPAGLDTEDGWDLLLEDGSRLMLEAAGQMDISTWPFPQFFVGSRIMILAYKTKIYEVGSDWSVTEKITVTGGDVWDFVDFGTYILLLNGEVMVYVDPTDSSYNTSTGSTTFPLIGTGCNFKGQIVGGDVRSSWNSCDRQSIVYSDIGSASFALDRKNEAGFRHSRRKGNVLKVARLGDGVVAYGENFVDLMVPYNQYFKIAEILDVGINWKGCVGVTNDMHIFMDNKRYLWAIDREFKLTRLGYQEFLEDLVDNHVVISGVQDEQRFYICDGVKCYVYTPRGMFEGFQLISSVATLDDAVVGTFKDTEDYEARLTTGAMDFGHRGIKTLMGVECGISEGGTNYIGADYRYDTNGTFSRTTLSRLSPDGFGYVGAAAHDLRVHVKATNYEQCYLDYINAKIKLEDRRFAVRGPYRRDLDVT